MSGSGYTEIPKVLLLTLNQLYSIEYKLALHGDDGEILKHVQRIKDALSAEGLFFEDPMGQRFSATRADLEASIIGDSTENLVVVGVIKPVIRYGDKSRSRVVQRGIVVVRSRDATAHR